MKFELTIFDELFDHPLERIIGIIDNYLSGLIKIKPDAVLRVEIEEGNLGKVWKGFLEEPKEWGKDDIVFGHIEIFSLFENSATPMQVKLFCSHPDFIPYWVGLRESLLRNLETSDGTPPPTKDPWMLISDNGYDRKLLEYWHKGYTAPEIAKKLYISVSSVNERLRILRKKYKEKIVPYHYRARNQA